ncbi:phospholipid/cholesterol/gamma-HCH transport system substrate-binding protein [Pseudorhodobacter antarcticus]|jgi:phospholipid/cholesterol/gamma-HCH transport system substrate-binding protein|uniref:Phospholipid/cholesterol/gamma-HCH transport system substrate-binding protein n=1 Tax=Pseudorhodobacter antarcticus TaxID=1077947 RepID=A0A1H8LQN4_9RHOB|nr:MlaD family protein [Pseudorhodobacter antarcticus]SEO07400.1 phospholipid/cholesterol/gamma-HCH transport system substrate-binding protein [Pseudorhodobacter antarcticus]
METRANYVLIGLFTILGFIGMLAFTLWFARVELDRQFAYYDVKFTSVSGLARASDVRFAGLPVGQVVEVRLSPDNDGSILVRLEVAQDTPVRTGSVATIESQGVTGVSFVGISPGEAGEAMLRDTSDLEIPQITPGRSMLQTLSEDAPAVVEEVLALVREISSLITNENVGRIDNILANVERASEGFAQSLDDFTVVAGAISGFAIEISNFNVMLEDVTTQAEQLFQTADQTLIAITDLAKETQTTMETGTKTLEQTTQTMTTAETYITTDLARIATNLTEGLTETRAQISTLGDQARTMLAEFQKTGETATARLNQAEATIKATDDMLVQLDITLESMDKASISFDDLVTKDGAEMVAEARAALAPIAAAAQNDLPAMVADIRAATATANQVMTDVGASLTSATAKADGVMDTAATALASVTDSFTRANTTLTAINSALAVGERTLIAAEKTFDGADRVINEDISAITTDLRRTIQGLDEAIAGVSAAIPQVTADVTAASDAARETFEQVARTVAAADPPIRDFTNAALPQFTRLARETRELINNLDQLTKQIRRDPARFFLGGNTPVFNR